MTDEKRLQDQMQAHEDRDRVRELTRYDPHPQDYDDARTTPHGFTGADLSDFHASEAPVGEVATERLPESLTVSGPWADAFVRLIEAVQAPVIERAEEAEAAWKKWQDRAAERDTSAGLREALERLLEFPNWTYIHGVLTAVLLPEDIRAVLAAHSAPEPAADRGVGVVEQAARVLWRSDWPSEDGTEAAQALADAGLLIPDDWSQRAERVEHYVADLQARLEGQRDEARARVAELEAEVERWTEKAQEAGKAYADVNSRHHEEWERANRLEGMADRLSERCVELEDYARERDQQTQQANEARIAAEARARRAEALLAELVDDDPCWFDHKGGCQAHGFIDLKPGETCPHQDAKDLLSAADQTSDATPSDAGERGEP